mmetsp:Transcript_38933/g.73062  ORF Transcript_38933/g.73062 Transcript_38933/m.73062 type:complete len:86 (-) Transcript_38933:121-378(-)|eukprot:CAMPEP_0114319274 /NCGR_PEP_ID=MMETSP0059-20121206/25150_1 /TAXON_ID=36894 /ORGANISM="Pyramimonas parkeae, Strain CCMP726" /LENGTH=85 /DNA_ID=CAMNT_0001446263 /DNA_START=78 /DNA_END=335 /DNA_ORIENTATION=+
MTKSTPGTDEDNAREAPTPLHVTNQLRTWQQDIEKGVFDGCVRLTELLMVAAAQAAKDEEYVGSKLAHHYLCRYTANYAGVCQEN